MLAVISSAQTKDHYCREAARLTLQYQRENPGADRWNLPIVETAEWFLESGGRWSDGSIRIYALALEQEIECLLEHDKFDRESLEGQLLQRLKTCRPASSKKVKKTAQGQAIAHQKKVAGKQKKSAAKKRKGRRKSLPMRELRLLVAYFRSRPDEFALWIAGYILFGTRLGWRPGEIIDLQRHGTLIRAAAEKHTNNRGLAAFCEVDIAAYFEKSRLFKAASLEAEIDRWIADARKWEAYYGGRVRLQAVIAGRLVTASKNCKIARVCSYTFRHFAISCLKASHFTCAEIAVIVNHASDRTAGEHYGKRKHGVKRPKKMFGFDPLRLPLVRNLARRFNRQELLEKKSAEVAPALELGDETPEIEAVSPFSFH